MAVSVDWDFARKVAGKVSGEDTFADADHNGAVSAEMVRLTSQAEQLVEAETGLVSNAGSARGKTIDRLEWVDVNLSSFQRLLRPLLERMGSEAAEPTNVVTRSFNSASEAIGPKISGAEVGAMLGWMSSRVLGQYDLLVIEDERPEDQDWVYYVGTNMLNIEKRFGFPPSEFRLWLAAHECTHRAQFTGVPWLRPYFLSLVNGLLDSVEADPSRLVDAAKTFVADRRAGGQTVKDGGLAALLATPEQKDTMDKMTGLMSLLEGHGDVIMSRATEELIPSQERFARIMSSRRSNASFVAKFIQRITGLEGKLAQYAEGENFIAAVEKAGGQELFDQVWVGPEALPTIEEIRKPDLWITRMGAPLPS